MGLKNKLSKLILCFLAIVMLASVQYSRGAEEKVPKPVSTNNSAEAKDHKVVVYYFHGNKRCHTCKRIEQLTREAVENFFNDEMSTGLVELKVINVDEPENKQFVKKYELFTKSVIVSDTQSGREKQWKNLQRIWELVHNDQAFKEYIRDEIKAYLS